MYKPEWRNEDEQRMLRLERLYVLDGRHRKTLSDGSPNPYYGIYTGLAAKADELEASM
tara:strand:+ start:41 stop:214 length:174 start_codon:yes stop_codon:yes gene_type:complete